MLYLGYVGFSIAFSFAVAALIEGRIDAAWARWVRPWTLLAWMCLTLGIAMGSYWAYYGTGWGGFWFWDPVENASLMPWLAGTALLHSAVVMEKRNSLKVWAARGGDTPYSGDNLQLGDVIYSINNSPVTHVASLRKQLDQLKDADSLVLQVERSGRLIYVTLEME